MERADGTRSLEDVVRRSVQRPGQRPARGTAAPGRLRAAVLGAALAGAVACAAALAQRSALDDDALRIDGQRAKLEDLAARGREFDVLFFGSSYLHRGLDPSAIDARLAERGHAVRTYNCAFAAGFSFETDAILRRVVSELTGPGPRGEPQRLRWAVVEFPDWSPDSKNLSALRTVAWHDATQTRNVLRAVAAGERPSRRVRQGAEHVRLFLTQALGAGFGPIAWDELTGGSRAPIEALLPSVAAARGFNPLGKEGGDEPGSEPEDDVPAAKRHEDFLANAAEYEASVAALRDGGGKAKGLKDYPLAALRSQMQFLEERGVRVVYVVPPVPWRVAHADRLAAKGVVPSLLMFNDPAKHPAIFEVSGRFDRGHVNVKGAAAFSLALADAFADVLSADAARAEGGRR